VGLRAYIQLVGDFCFPALSVDADCASLRIALRFSTHTSCSIISTMQAEFVKMHGGGNDFVFIDNMNGTLDFFGSANVIAICDRRRGIGADGVVLLEPPTSPSCACSWRFFNRDGSIGEMCGNGARCFAAFARRCGVVTGNEPFSFDTAAGAVSAQFIDGGQVSIGLTEPHGYRCFPRGLGGISELGTLHYIDTGVPHVVAVVHDVSVIDILRIGPIIRRYCRCCATDTELLVAQMSSSLVAQ
jgi:diaminopimelate epimerase